MPPSHSDTDTARSVERFSNKTLTSLFGERLLHLYRRRGPITLVSGHAFMLGPEANRFVFENPELFTNREAFESLGMVGDTALVVTDGEMHRHSRQLVQPVLRRRNLQDNFATIVRYADAAIDGWQPGQRIDVDRALRTAIRSSTTELLFGRRMVADATYLGERTRLLLDFFANVPQIVTLMRRLSTPQWHRAAAACRELDERIYAAIERARRESSECEDSLLAVLVHSTDETGEVLSDKRIRDQLFSLVTGAETMSDAIAFAIYAMLSTPGVWDQPRPKSTPSSVTAGRT